MFTDVLKLLIEISATLLGIALLIRVFINWVGLPARNPVAQFVFALTNWLVKPLKHVAPSIGRLDTASLVAAYFVAVLSTLLVDYVLSSDWLFARAFIVGAIRLVQWSLDGVFWLTVLYALLSWVNPHAPIAPAISALMRPFIAPFRRIIPLVGGVDLSPMALIVVIIVLREVLGRLVN